LLASPAAFASSAASVFFVATSGIHRPHLIHPPLLRLRMESEFDSRFPKCLHIAPTPFMPTPFILIEFGAQCGFSVVPESLPNRIRIATIYR
jgi:hypothetical protein